MSDLPSVFQLAVPIVGGSVPEPELTPTSCERLLQEAVRLGVFAAVYSNLRQTKCRPRDEKKRDRRLQATGAKNLFFKREQDRVLAGLRKAGIACLPVRGVALTEALYPDLFWRKIADIDLLITPGDVPRAYPVLKAMGLDDADTPWTEAALDRLARRASYHYPELRMSGSHSVSVELHWDWVEPELPRPDLLSDVDGYLVYLCRHAAKHLWFDLRWLTDIELLLRQREAQINWDRFWSLARAAGATRGCAGSLELCGRLFGGESVSRHRVPRRFARSGRRLALEAEKWLVHGKASPLWRYPAMQLLRVDSPAQRVRRIAGWLKPAPRCWSRPDGSTPSTAEVWLHRYRNLALRGAAAISPSSNWRRRLTRAAEWSTRDWNVLLRAWCLLPIVAAGVRGRRFPRTHAWAAAVRGVEPPTRPAERAAQVGALVKVAAQRHMARFACLPRSLALLRLLGREGISAELKLGVRHENGKVEGHAWVEHEGVAINEPGDPNSDFQPLAGARAEAQPSVSPKPEHSIRSSN